MNDHLLKKSISTIFNNSKNLASILSGIEAWYYSKYKEERESESEMKRESLNTSNHLLSKVESYRWNLLSQWYDGLSESAYYGVESW